MLATACRICELPIKEFDLSKLSKKIQKIGRGAYGKVTLHKDATGQGC
jgi:hypothetical protein